MNILVFSIAHDSSVCYLEDGVVKFFCKEERLSGTKRDKHPFKSLEKFRELFNVKLDRCLYVTPSNDEPDIEATYNHYVKKFFNVPLENYSGLLHHLCHATLAFCNSTFSEALVFVVDRNGSLFFVNGDKVAREAESVYAFSKQNSHFPLYKNFFLLKGEASKVITEHNIQSTYGSNVDIFARSSFGIVSMYEAATTLMGQQQLENGKAMGLSSYCTKTTFDPLVTDSLVDGRYFFDNATRFSPSLRNLGVCFVGEQQNITDEVTKENYAYYAEKAKHVQVESQKAVLELIERYVSETGIKNVCVVGGYGLNVVANAHYLEKMPDVNFYFEPVADDTGISIGAAMLKHFELTTTMPDGLKDNFYHYYDASEITPKGHLASLDDVCDLLIAQKSIGFFESCPESGPRALGHRSILFDCRNSNAKDLVNKIKNREWYRPFAGVMLEEHFDTYFETLGLSKSEFMTVNFKARPNALAMMPGVIHVDGTCRVQTVSSGALYNLLQKFYAKTGCPMLLNTSLNLAGMPLVQTKENANIILNTSELDYLYFVDDSILVSKKER